MSINNYLTKHWDRFNIWARRFVETKPQTMNYIKELQSENNEMRNTLMDIQNEIATLLIYYTSPKFQGFQNDFAHVSTDILPKLVKLREGAYIHIKREKK